MNGLIAAKALPAISRTLLSILPVIVSDLFNVFDQRRFADVKVRITSKQYIPM